MSDEKTTGRRTIRRFAHELYPHNENEWEPRPLSVEVPYLYARMVGHSIFGTGWMSVETPEGRRESTDRTIAYLNAVQVALLADALHQGLTGDEAWEWVDERYSDTDGHEQAWERAEHYGISIDRIKPYPCGPEPRHHDHVAERTRIVTRIPIPESECAQCTEPDDTPIEPIVLPAALVRHRLEDGVFICEGGARSACHVYPDCECERWYHDEETDKHPHPSVPHARCWMLDWLNNSDPRDTMLLDLDGTQTSFDFGVLLDGEVLLEWNGEDAVLWRYGSIEAAA